MTKLNVIMDAIADFFATSIFIWLYNAFSFIWVTLGIADKHFIDPFPSNFYTFLVSWLAIDMSCFILRKEKRSKEHEQRDNIHKTQMLEALVRNMEESTLTNELMKQVAKNQIFIMNEIMKRKED